MAASTLDVTTTSDGTLVIHPRCLRADEDATELRRALIHAIRHVRPSYLVLDLADVRELDSINLGALAAACHLGDDHQVTVFVDHTSAGIALLLTAAGVPTHRIRHIL
ncbi:STAS domain-containing protein [Actinoplanes sp. NPDC026670]|uniref:STAS domain-containing protein n=1 Tax=Actinoplanes sp. NPDC026670 TaxID=3154700 RepID=UPI0033D5DD11